MEVTQTKKASYDFYLIIATTVVLALISAICIWGMFYFKMAQIHEMAPAAKIAWQNQMNTIIAPFIIGLIVLLGIYPKPALERIEPAVENIIERIEEATGHETPEFGDIHDLPAATGEHSP